ncbi:MAG: porin family protein [Gammaproteobacteria bacterium]|nr:porin family protein [Gammaproteobacteria bacterium]
MKLLNRRVMPAVILSFALSPAWTGADDSGWSVMSFGGLSLLSDQNATGTALAAEQGTGAGEANGDIDVLLDNGFAAGLELRYNYDSPFSVGIGWEYRSNDSEIRLTDGTALPSGNYASNIFFLNGRYALATASDVWQPWVGAGLTVVQEIDLDSESTSGEQSFSDGGSVGFQLMAGVNRTLSDRWYLSGEIRYSDLRGLSLTSETGGNGRISDLDYPPVTLQLGLGYRFFR